MEASPVAWTLIKIVDIFAYGKITNFSHQMPGSGSGTRSGSALKPVRIHNTEDKKSTSLENHGLNYEKVMREKSTIKINEVNSIINN
jgi:hypothetical protein